MKLLLAPLYFALKFYGWFVLAHVILHWLIYFNIINTHHPLVYRLSRALEIIVSPALRYIRRFLKPIEGLDFAPLVLLFILYVAQYMVYQLMH